MLVVETYLSESPNRGWGLYSMNLIPKDTIIWEFKEGFDVEVHIKEYQSLNHIQKEFVDKYFWREGDYLYTSCDHSIFQNHSNNPNCVVSGEVMRASRDIHPDEEIFVNYQTFCDDFVKSVWSDDGDDVSLHPNK